MSFVLDLLAGEADGLAETQPRLDPAGSFGRAVVVDDALDRRISRSGQLLRIAASFRGMFTW
jgi:hypothetical protein